MIWKARARGNRLARSAPVVYARPSMPRIGVISDTHGLVRPQALRALAGADLIVHAGDIGSPDVLDALRALAPLVAVRGNNDRGAWAAALPETEVVDASGRSLYVLHDVKELDLDPRVAGFDAVIAGHSHQPRIDRRDGVLYLNPGSAGPRRFKLPIALAWLTVDAQHLDAEIVQLDV
jgi:putative phosphoesterase